MAATALLVSQSGDGGHDQAQPTSPSYSDRYTAASLAVNNADALKELYLCSSELRVEAEYKAYQERHGAPFGSVTSVVPSGLLRQAAVTAEAYAESYGISCAPDVASITPIQYRLNDVTLYPSDFTPTFDVQTVCGAYQAEAFMPTPQTSDQYERNRFLQARRQELIQNTNLAC